ncbi:MAG: hypothetical protein ABMA13_22225 [Chthoniobacteraceae bacterium]
MALLGELDISGAGALKSLGSLDKAFGNLAGNLGKFGAIAGGSFVAFQGLNSIIEGFKETLDLGGTLNDMKAQTGEAVGDLVILRQAFDNAGLGASKLQDAIAGVNEDGKSTAGALRTLGTSAAELRNLPAIGQIEKLQQGFAKLDQTSKVAAARDLFGKSGGASLALFTDSGALDQARQQAGPLAGIMEKNVGTFDKLGDVINGLKLNFQEFFAGALSKVAPEATNIADALASVDFVGIGETVGALASVFLKLGEALALLAPLINSASEGLSSIFGSSSKADSGLSEKYRGFAKLDRAETTATVTDKSPVSGLQRIGGGGGFGGGGDAVLTEARTHTRLLERIADGVGRQSGGSGGALEAVPV